MICFSCASYTFNLQYGWLIQLERLNHKLSLYLLNLTGVSFSLGMSISKTPPIYVHVLHRDTFTACPHFLAFSLFRDLRREKSWS